MVRLGTGLVTVGRGMARMEKGVAAETGGGCSDC